ncbi:hypothetical protein Ctob_003890 [Chrysochromulina tobinii]|uniref:Uncharacterized protein n=1 Tax=Chrysochromulina tobinii TaxID=1460289 RepID=A0A0M0JRE9_9EUKA|nr:hypothetical protein Ctob_003890 [Chrysochromulina tobinii]|eukprot:KOO29040.1 hypothetical protein Ctob_003890 [Chrysochromulina sp. CCMP291]
MDFFASMLPKEQPSSRTGSRQDMALSQPVARVHGEGRLPFADVEDDLRLDWQQLHMLSCEALLLCMPAQLHKLSERDNRALRHVLGHLLGVTPSTLPEVIAATLRLEGYDDPAHLEQLQPYLHYRLLLLVQKRPADFASPEAFCAWAERQIALTLAGLIGVEYTSLVRALHGCVWEAYASLEDEVATAAFEHRLELPYPISLKLYALLLLATFGDDGVPLDCTEAIVILLARVRRCLRVPIEVHRICLAEATFAMHRRHPESIDLAAALLRRLEQLPNNTAPLPNTAPRPHTAQSPNTAPHPGTPAHQGAVASVEARALDEICRCMRNHFSLLLGNFHSTLPTAPVALIQHMLDAYVHLYSAYLEPPEVPPEMPPEVTPSAAGSDAQHGADDLDAVALNAACVPLVVVDEAAIAWEEGVAERRGEHVHAEEEWEEGVVEVAADEELVKAAAADEEEACPRPQPSREDVEERHEDAEAAREAARAAKAASDDDVAERRVPWMSLPAWYDGEGLPNWGLVLGGPPPPVLEEVTALCRSSIRRCWLDLCGQVIASPCH